MTVWQGIAARRRQVRARRFYRQFVPRGGLCFDVGANMGDRSELFLSLGARVVAVEPQEACQHALRARFGSRLVLVEAALGAEEGEGELLVASYHTLSSLSREWTDAVRASGRFDEFDWDRHQRVRVTTLDALVDAYGTPDFCKIDVEGYELEVLRGLTRPLPALSFEFTVERLESRLLAAEHVDRLGMGSFNYSPGESMRLALDRWIDLEGMIRFLRDARHTPATFGDVYARAAG